MNEETNQFELLLKKEVSKACVLGTIEFEIPADTSYRNCKKRHTRKTRSVRQEIRICSVSLRPPRRKSKKLNAIEIQVVHCKEINTPEGEQPVEWFLITSVPIKHWIGQSKLLIGIYVGG